MKKGTIKFYNEEKGYGFITETGADKDIFFHVSGLISQEIEKGDEVSFDTQEGKKGIVAINVTLV